MVELGNIYYFIYIIISLIYFFSLFFILKNKNKDTIYKVLLIISFCNLGLHFLKLMFEPYRSGLPGSIRKITFENICAVSTLVFPFILLYKKNNTLNNYMYFIGMLGGIGALVYPTEAFNKDICFDVIRFYICHTNLYTVPLLLCIFGIIKLDYKKLFYMPILFLLIEFLIFINELALINIGFVDCSINEFFSRDYRNSSFIFGPIRSLDNISKIITIFVPKIFMKDILLINNGNTLYWPIIWMVIPAFIYLPIVFLVISLPFTYKDLKLKRRK